MSTRSDGSMASLVREARSAAHDSGAQSRTIGTNPKRSSAAIAQRDAKLSLSDVSDDLSDVNSLYSESGDDDEAFVGVKGEASGFLIVLSDSPALGDQT